MPAGAKLNELAERKRALVLQADCHREAIGAERRHIAGQCAAIRDQVASGWWFGAAASASQLLPGSMGHLLQQLPLVLSAVRNDSAAPGQDQP